MSVMLADIPRVRLAHLPTPLDLLGYFRCGLELLRQADEHEIRIDHIIHATGSCGTQAGLVAAMLATNSGVRVTGISVSRSASELVPLATDLTRAVLAGCTSDRRAR